MTQEASQHLVANSFDIDFVFPFVDNREPIWYQSYYQACKATNRTIDARGARFEDIGLLPYVIRGIIKNMPFIRYIFIIVSNPEQVPESIQNYVDTGKVRIVLHKDIIPAQFLPTFNSTTIEMFLHNIPDLAEHFIYSNDDMIPLGPMQAEDFFTKDNHIHLSLLHGIITNKSLQFKKVCSNCFHLVQMIHKLPPIFNNRLEYLRPEHSLTPMIKSHNAELIEKASSVIYPAIRAFRTEFQHNQYIFSLQECFVYGHEEATVKFEYMSYKRSLQDICAAILDPNIQVLCLNDCVSPHRELILKNKQKILDALNVRLSEKVVDEVDNISYNNNTTLKD